jgi:hypothetical protein
MKLAQTTLSKLRRSDLFVENRSAQGLQLRRSGIFRPRADVAPTELEIFLDAVATKIPRLRRWEKAQGGMTVAPASWSAPAKRSDDGAFARQDAPGGSHTPGQSGVALRLPPQSKIAADSSTILFQTMRPASGLSRRDSLKIARRFNAGNGSPCVSSPAGACWN